MLCLRSGSHPKATILSRAALIRLRDDGMYGQENASRPLSVTLICCAPLPTPLMAAPSLLAAPTARHDCGMLRLAQRSAALSVTATWYSASPMHRTADMS